MPDHMESGSPFRPIGLKMQFFYAFFTAILPAVCFGLDYIILFSAAILFGLYLNSWIVEKIGGTTGDTYGFITEITEAFIAFLFVLLVKGGAWHI